MARATDSTSKPPVRPAATSAPVADSALLGRAEELLIQRCMREDGFQYWVTTPNQIPDQKTFPYVVDDVAWASRHGYGSDLYRQVDQLRAADPNSRYLATLSPQRQQAAVTALNGPTPTGLKAVVPGGGVVQHSAQGCVSAAERTLYLDLSAWYQAKKVTDTLAGLRAQRVLADPAYLAAVGHWSTCVRAMGFAFGTPDQMRASVSFSDTPAARATEIRTAVAEATCANRTDLAATAHRLDAQYATAVEQQYRTEVDNRHRLETAAVVRAPRRCLVLSRRPGFACVRTQAREEEER
ncbi:hypothetical protein [Fodinicola feengrottensis]|uniref:hypothetical protein n=1 Tax=Fodinicola feengrottensis TaxID=435914 RepID=UPI0013D8B58D|nr:hypothetical protein [Fodinicola feengrottensis]